MEDLAERVIELLGKPVSGSAFQHFVNEYCPLKRPVRHELNAALVKFFIPELGLSVWTDYDVVFQVCFYVVPNKFENDFETGTYTSQLPLKASVGDRRSDVHTKIGTPDASRRIDNSNINESYYLGTVDFVFWYELPSESITEVRVGLLSQSPWGMVHICDSQYI